MGRGSVWVSLQAEVHPLQVSSLLRSGSSLSGLSKCEKVSFCGKRELAEGAVKSRQGHCWERAEQKHSPGQQPSDTHLGISPVARKDPSQRGKGTNALRPPRLPSEDIRLPAQTPEERHRKPAQDACPALPIGEQRTLCSGQRETGKELGKTKKRVFVVVFQK